MHTFKQRQSAVEYTRLRGDSFDWSEERIAELERLLANGLSPGKISKLWKDLPNAPSRDSIIGKSRRAGFIKATSTPTKPRAVAAPVPKKPTAPPARKPGGNHTLGKKRLKAVTAPAPVERVKRAPIEPPTMRIVVSDLNKSMCRYIIGDPQNPDFTYCGRATQGASQWCAYCRNVVYQKQQAA